MIKNQPYQGGAAATFCDLVLQHAARLGAPAVLWTLCLGIVACSSAILENGVSPRPRSTVPINVAYGSLAFEGTVERIDLGSEYEFRPHIQVTFRADEEVNQVPRAALSGLMLVATIPREGQPAQMLHREIRPISVVLSRDGESRRLPDFVFRLSKSIYDQAELIAVAVTDGRLLWPIPAPLK